MAHPLLPTSSDSSKSCSRNCTNYTRVGIGAVLAYLIFLVATGEIIEIGRLGNNVGSSSSGVGGSDNVMKDSRIDCSTSVTAAIVQTPSNSNTPTKQRIYNPSYNYPAKHNEWDKQYGKIIWRSVLEGISRLVKVVVAFYIGSVLYCVCIGIGHSRNGQLMASQFKHWFQEEDPERVPSKSAVVVSMYRDPYDWVWAMKERPHHAHDHIGLEWRPFVTKPWIGKRGPNDKNITLTPGLRNNVTCLERYSFKEIIPCSKGDSPSKKGYADYKYELYHDGSERAYSSIVDLRKEKIENHLSVAEFDGTRAFYPFRYEDLEANSTQVLLDLLEGATGIRPRCNATEPRVGGVKHKTVPKEFVEWMNQFVDWDVEYQIGYMRR
ncbi:predicted protein [Thalassiosira pseudonana CCMP1335]|uniref:Sulfotransferase domain-containing protein n=1 Tax=Thalassiosira pseudonana TaxID=35128 RepID=B5YLG9_THAPS|nr:predicted protein [Thalassiosira pseudonana CCMP1335]ACI64228.1 predicted protein [Thalassiosira pseudonana CCMP1335]